MGNRSDRRGVIGAKRLGHRVGMRVLDLDQAADRVVRVVRVPECFRDLPEVESSVGSLGKLADGRADDHGVAGRLVHHHVAVPAGDRLLPAREVRQL